MHNIENVRRMLNEVKDHIDYLELFSDMDLVGDDTRHLVDSINAAKTEHGRLEADTLEEAADLKFLYDRLKNVHSSIKVIRNTIGRLEERIEAALDITNNIAGAVEDNTNEDNQDY